MKRQPYGPLVDLTLVGLLLLVGLYHWPHVASEGAPWWATPQDLLLDGYDAGEWADQHRAWRDGRLGDLDGHRMPTWTLLAGPVASVSVPLAGHLVNHLLQLALAPIVYGLGRALGMGRGTSAFAGVIVATNATLVLASRRFGVDPTITTLVPLALLACHLVRVRWWLGLLAGAVGALATASHFTTLPYPAPLALSVVLLARPGERVPSLIAFCSGFLLAWGVVFDLFPWIGVETLLKSVGESASNQVAGTPGARGWESAVARVSGILANDLEGAFNTYGTRMHTAAPPAVLLVPLAMLGVAGVGLDTAGPKARTPGWIGGLLLALSLAPAVALVAMQAPSRYSDNLLPLATLLAARGLASLLVPLRHTPRPDLAAGALASVLALRATAGGFSSGNLQLARFNRDVGALLEAQVAPRTCVVSPLRDAVAYTDLHPIRIDCPVAATEASFRACLSGLRRQCFASRSLVWVVNEQVPVDTRSAPLKAMDAWALANWGSVGELRTPGASVWLVQVPLPD